MTYHSTVHARGGLPLDVIFPPEPRTQPEIPCSICGGDVETQPMKPGICYDCYRDSTRETNPVIRIDSLQKRMPLVPHETEIATVHDAEREVYGEGPEEFDWDWLRAAVHKAIDRLETKEIWRIGNEVIFGSTEWFDQTDEIPF